MGVAVMASRSAPGPFARSAVALPHAEAVLLVDDHEREARWKTSFVGKRRMRAEEHAERRPRRRRRSDLRALRGRAWPP